MLNNYKRSYNFEYHSWHLISTLEIWKKIYKKYYKRHAFHHWRWLFAYLLVKNKTFLIKFVRIVKKIRREKNEVEGNECVFMIKDGLGISLRGIFILTIFIVVIDQRSI